MLYNKIKLYNQKLQERQHHDFSTKLTRQQSTLSGKTLRKTQQQILASLEAPPVPEVEDTNSEAVTGCNMTCQVTCPQNVSGILASRSWDTTKSFSSSN